MENVEVEICLERNPIHNQEIDAKICKWIPNVGSTRARDTKY